MITKINTQKNAYLKLYKNALGSTNTKYVQVSGFQIVVQIYSFAGTRNTELVRLRFLYEQQKYNNNMVAKSKGYRFYAVPLCSLRHIPRALQESEEFQRQVRQVLQEVANLAAVDIAPQRRLDCADRDVEVTQEEVEALIPQWDEEILAEREQLRQLRQRLADRWAERQAFTLEGMRSSQDGVDPQGDAGEVPARSAAEAIGGGLD